ncbi:MAG: TenA family transcriptional regulator [Candidatus Kapaibacteriales bacterium]
MELKKRLLEHPFYQAWTKGEITKEQLSIYHSSYREFIGKVPEYWNKAINGLGDDSAYGKKVVAEETEHIDLWEGWVSRLPQNESFPRMTEIMESLDTMTPSELLGAIHAFEVQQPEVAVTKKEGLMCHYGYNEEELKYFDDHQEEEGHIRFGAMLAEKSANKEEFKAGFERGSELFYKGLDLFLN